MRHFTLRFIFTFMLGMFLFVTCGMEDIMAEEIIPDRIKDNLAVFTVPDTAGSESSITVEAHSEFFIRIKSNITTGYSWELAQPLDKEKLEWLGKYDEENEQDAEAQRLLGASGYEVVKLKAHDHSLVTLELQLIRPWEKGVEPQKKIKIAITVGNGNPSK